MVYQSSMVRYGITALREKHKLYVGILDYFCKI